MKITSAKRINNWQFLLGLTTLVLTIFTIEKPSQAITKVNFYEPETTSNNKDKKSDSAILNYTQEISVNRRDADFYFN